MSEDIFKNFDLDKNQYIIGDIRLQLKDITRAQLYNILEKFDEMEQKDVSDLTDFQKIKLEKEWWDFFIPIVFDKVENKKLENQLTPAQYSKAMAEVFAFLKKFGSSDGAKEFMSTLKEAQTLMKKKSEKSS